MIEKFSDVQWVGFDLDGTLYQPTLEIQQKINNCIREEIAKKILEKKEDLISIQNARNYFEERYAELNSGSKVLREAGYEDAGKVMDYCQENANILKFIHHDSELVGIMEELGSKYKLYLLTSSPEKIAISKLEKIGIDPNIFSIRIYNDTPVCGSKLEGEAFEFLLQQTGIPADLHLYVGDTSKKDILPAKSKGMLTLAVGSQIQEADYFIKEIKQIKEVLL